MFFEAVGGYTSFLNVIQDSLYHVGKGSVFIITFQLYPLLDFLSCFLGQVESWHLEKVEKIIMHKTPNVFA